MDKPCVLFEGSLDNGYGYFSAGGRKVWAHRAAYIEQVGPIPPKYEIDHLCGVRNCIEPTHLEAVTQAENKRRQAERQTHCKQGHEFDEENTYRHPVTGYRTCRACRRADYHRAKLRSAA